MKIAVICDVIGRAGGAPVSAVRFSKGLSDKGHKVIMIAAENNNKYPVSHSENLKMIRLPSIYTPFLGESAYLAKPQYLKLREMFKKEQVDLVHLYVPSPLSFSAFFAAKYLNVPLVSSSHIQPEDFASRQGIDLKTFFRFIYLLIAEGIKAQVITIINLFTARLRLSNEIRVKILYLKLFYFVMPRITKSAISILFKHKDRVAAVDAFLYDLFVWLYNNSDAVICPNNFGKILLEYHGLKKDTVLISNGIDSTEFYVHDDREIRRKYKLADDKIVLYVGRLVPKKRVEDIIEAFSIVEKKIEKVRLVIGGVGECRDSLMAQAGKLGIENKVIFAGYIPQADLPEIYSAADLFVLPSTTELEGMVVLEAMACGCPIIVADSEDSAARSLINKNGYLYKAGDFRKLADCAINILSNKEIEDAFKKQSLMNSKEYSLANSVENLEAVYNGLSGN